MKQATNFLMMNLGENGNIDTKFEGKQNKCGHCSSMGFYVDCLEHGKQVIAFVLLIGILIASLPPGTKWNLWVRLSIGYTINQPPRRIVSVRDNC